MMINRVWPIFTIVCLSAPILAGDASRSYAKRVDVSGGEAIMYSHERVLLGLSCSSGPVGKLFGLSEIRLGDTVKQGNYSFRTGIIEVVRHGRDIKEGNKTYARKGDVECVLAASASKLPYDDKCDALWVRVTNCRPLE